MDRQDLDGADRRPFRSRLGGHRPITRSWLVLTGAIVVTALLATSACGGGDGFAAEARAEVPRAPATEADADPAVAANDALAVDLYRELAAADRGDNLVLSPYSPPLDRLDPRWHPRWGESDPEWP